MSKTTKQRKYYAITTKDGKYISPQHTKPDSVIKMPLHLFLLMDGKVNYIASQSVSPISKHSSACLLTKEVYTASSGIPLQRLLQFASHHSPEELTKLLQHKGIK